MTNGTRHSRPTGTVTAPGTLSPTSVAELLAIARGCGVKENSLSALIILQGINDGINSIPSSIMKNRIDQLFSKLRENDKAAFVAYICAGDPDAERCLEIMQALDRAGVDLIEMGVPFSDPLADGIVNQMAAGRALTAGASVENTLEIIKAFRKNSSTPIVLFTYLNPIYAYGFKRFHEDASRAGADGILNLDLPPDEESHNAELMEANELLNIRIIAPTTPVERMAEIAGTGKGFIYYISRE